MLNPFFIVIIPIVVITILVILASIIAIFVWIVKKLRLEPLKNVWLIVPSVLLIGGIINLLFCIFLYNSVFEVDTHYSDESEVTVIEDSNEIYWADEYQDSFVMNNIIYNQIYTDNFYSTPEKAEILAPIADVKFYRDSNNFIGNLFLDLANTPYENDYLNMVSKIYPVVNDANCELYLVSEEENLNDAYYYDIYAPNSELHNIIKYYSNPDNYNTQKVTYEHSTMVDDEYISYDDIMTIQADSELIKSIFNYSTANTIALFTEENEPYEYYCLSILSNDNLFTMDRSIYIIDDEVYVADPSYYDQLFINPLPDDIAKQIITMLNF